MKDKEGHGSEAQDKAEHHGRWNMESGKEESGEGRPKNMNQARALDPSIPYRRKD